MLGPAGMAAAAKPDGYTLSQLTISAFRQPYIQKVEWDPLRDFTYIIGISGYTFGLVVKNDSPIKSLEDFLAYANARRAAETLLDPTGLGRIRVLVAAKGAPADLACLSMPMR